MSRFSMLKVAHRRRKRLVNKPLYLLGGVFLIEYLWKITSAYLALGKKKLCQVLVESGGVGRGALDDVTLSLTGTFCEVTLGSFKL